MTLLMSSPKPMSSMRSASSSTRVSRLESSRVPCSRCLRMRPGVPTAMWAPKPRVADCGAVGVPPHRVTSLTFGRARARRRISWAT
ncbi:hypothetical protein D3C74_444500 [compost metagenome]